MENSFESLEAYWKQHNKKEESNKVLNKNMVKEMLASRTQTTFEKLKTFINVFMGVPLMYIISQLLNKELPQAPWLLAIMIIIYGFIIYTSILNYKAWHILIHGKLSEESITATVEKMLRITKKIRNYNFYFYFPIYTIVLPLILRRIFDLFFPDKGIISLTITGVAFLVLIVLYFIKIIFPRIHDKDAFGIVIKELEATSIELKNVD